MPWEEVSIMHRRKEFVSLALSEGSNVSELCRRFGISRQTGYKWLRRAAVAGEDFRDRSRRPKRSPERTAADVEMAILSVRDGHPAWGARKIAHCLGRDGIAAPAASTVHAVLRRHGRVVAGPGLHKAAERFEKPRPNQLWQMDFKGQVKLSSGSWVHPLTVIDDHSRYALCLRACPNERTETVRAALSAAFRTYGLPDAFYVDNGNPWGNAGQERWTRLGVWLLKLGVDLIHSRPYHPQGRGKNERFHRTLKAEVLAFERFADIPRMQKAFDSWRVVYNSERPHQALDMRVPASCYQPSPRPLPRAVPDVVYGPDDVLRRVGTTKAYVSFKGRLWPVSRAFQGETVAIRPTGNDGKYGVYFATKRIAEIDLNT
jgi:transposase InsO family protein